MAPKSFRESLGPLLLIIFIFFFNIFSRSILSPLLLDVEADFSISHTRASRFFLFISLGHAAMMLFSGFVSAKLMHKGTIALSSLVIAAALLLAAASSQIWMLQLSLVLLGAGAGLYPPSGISIITSMVEKKDWQKALSFHELGPHFGMAAVPLFVVVLKNWLDWRGVVAAAGICVLGALILFQVFVKVGKERGEAPTFSNLLPLLKLPSFWILMLFMGFVLGSIQGIYLLIPTFMVAEAGFDPVFTNTVFGISRFAPIVALLTTGLILDKIGIRRTIFITMVFSGAAIVLLGLLSRNWLTAVIFLQPAVGAVAVPSVLAAMSAIAPKSSRNVALSMSLPAASLFGNGVIPAFVGYMGDAATFSLGFILVGGVMILLSVLTVFIKGETDT